MENRKKSGRKPLSPELVRNREIAINLNDEEFLFYRSCRKYFGNKAMASRIRKFVEELYISEVRGRFF